MSLISSPPLKGKAPSGECLAGSPCAIPLATTSALVTARDRAGNQRSDAITVEVVDTTPPSVEVLEDDVVEAQDPAGTAVEIVPAVEDRCDAQPTVTLWRCQDACVAFDGLADLGENAITIRAVDASGNSGEAVALVTVVDTTGPTITLSSDSLLVNSPQGDPIPFADIPFPAPTLADNGYATADLSWEIHEPPSLFPLGETTVQYRAWDPGGNESWASLTVVVQ